jgi:hypothetical protein
VRFFGVHGTNEDGPANADADHLGMGATVGKVWSTFGETARVSNGTDVWPVNFPRYTVNLEAELRLSFQGYVLDAARLAYQVQRLEGGADKGAAALAEHAWKTYQACGTRTRYVLVGYSQGAWAVSKFLRGGGGAAPNPVLPAVLGQVAGVLLIGDPAWPISDKWPGLRGIASAVGRGVSSPYVVGALKDKFRSLCVSYDPDVHDSICMFSNDLSKLSPGIAAHTSYVTNGMAEDSGRWLASLVNT